MKIRYYQDNLNKIGVLLDSFFNELQRFRVKHISFHEIMKYYTSSYTNEYNGFNDILLAGLFECGNKMLELIRHLPDETEILSIDAKPVPFTLHIQINSNSNYIIFYQNKYHIKLSLENEFDVPENITHYLR